jgi:AraC-like DNA-binding protein
MEAVAPGFVGDWKYPGGLAIQRGIHLPARWTGTAPTIGRNSAQRFESMNAKFSFEPHLAMHEVLLPPGGEWNPSLPGWVLAHVTSGQAYSLHPQKNQKLETGSVVALPWLTKAYIRASQLGEVLLHYFHVEFERLMGLVDLAEQQFLQNSASRDDLPRVLLPSDAISEQFRKFCGTVGHNGFSTRLQLLDICTEVLGHEFKNPAKEPQGEANAKARIAGIVRQLPASALLDLDFDDLVQRMHCSPRHVSRLFNEVVGMSFREKKSEVRLLRARELLSDGKAKIVDVALESGYHSISLFNLMFKKRFGVTPGKWRAGVKSRQSSKKPLRRSATLRSYGL